MRRVGQHSSTTTLLWLKRVCTDKFIYFNVLRRCRVPILCHLSCFVFETVLYTSLHNPGSTNLSQQFTVILKIIAKGCAREALHIIHANIKRNEKKKTLVLIIINIFPLEPFRVHYVAK